jgi:hypothetical protein
MRNGSFRKSSTARIGGFLKDTLRALGVQEKLLEQKALEKWAQAVGPQIAASSKAEDVHDGVLFVSCKSSTWSSELTLHKLDIVKKLNAAVGKEVIKDIRFTARGFRKAEEIQHDDGVTVRVDAIELDAEETKAADEAASVCESDELARKIKDAILTSKRLKEAKLREGYKRCSKCSELHNGKYDLCDSCRTLQ